MIVKDINNTQFIIDASVVLKWFSRTDEPYVREAESIQEAVYKRSIILYSPDLLIYEVGNALLKGKQLPHADVQKFLEALFAIGILLLEMTLPLSQQAVVIADSMGITFYDASYMALARALSAPLISANPKHHKSIKGVTVIPLEEWGRIKNGKKNEHA